MPGSCAKHVWRVVIFAIAACTPFLAISLNAEQSQAPAKLSMDLDLPGYEAELDRCDQAVQHRDAIPQLRQSLPRIWHVRTSEGTVQVSTTWLSSELEKLEQEPATHGVIANQIKSHLAAMRQAATELETVSHDSWSANARERLDKILDRREFAGERGPSQLELLQARISRWIERQLLRLLSRLHPGAQAGDAMSWAIVGIAFFALCYWIVQSLAGHSRSPQQFAAVASPSNNPRTWARDALAAADRGDYREAIHCAYWAGVVHLEARGMLKSDRARTPRESLRLLDPHPTEQELLREFTRLFELIWYGYRPASANDWSSARTHLENMGCLTPSTPATANS
jgi:hypothetical protein